MRRLVLLRHGESVWNKENRFTGWTDVALTEEGEQEAVNAGRVLRRAGFVFDVAFTSVLHRAVKSLWLVLEEMDLMWIPIHQHWRLNERHYGALQGASKAMAVERFGAEQVQLWRRSYEVRPPAREPTSDRSGGTDPRYAHLPPEVVPLTESLADTVERVVLYYYESIAPLIRNEMRVFVVSHSNSLRALVKHLDDISDEDIVGLNIPTGIPRVYDLDEDLKPVRSFYLGDPKAARPTIE